MSKHGLVFATSLIVAAMPTLAFASPALRVGGTVGLGTPIGEAGVEATLPVKKDIELGVGAGMALGGPQVAVMPRLRIGAFSLGVGVSAGRYWHPAFEDAGALTTNALWGNVEVGAERTLDGGYFVRAFAGVGKVLVHDEIMCTADDTAWCEQATDLPYFGVTIGKAL